jgi:hypothetical protein
MTTIHIPAASCTLPNQRHFARRVTPSAYRKTGTKMGESKGLFDAPQMPVREVDAHNL